MPDARSVGVGGTSEMTIAVMMGVSGSGKTTIARGVAEREGWRLLEGDVFHPPSNIAKMHAGTPLPMRIVGHGCAQSHTRSTRCVRAASKEWSRARR